MRVVVLLEGKQGEGKTKIATKLLAFVRNELRKVGAKLELAVYSTNDAEWFTAARMDIHERAHKEGTL